MPCVIQCSVYAVCENPNFYKMAYLSQKTSYLSWGYETSKIVVYCV